MAFWCLFDSTIRKVGSTNNVLRYLPIEATGKALGEKEVLFNCFDKSWI